MRSEAGRQAGGLPLRGIHAGGDLYVSLVAEKLPDGLPHSRSLVLLPGIPSDPNTVAIRVKQGECVMDSLQAAQYLARAGLQVRAATKTCVPEFNHSAYVETACAADAAGVFSSFAFVATYLSMAASHCSQTINLPAMCASSITGLMAGLAKVAVQASFMAANCKGGASYEEPPPAVAGDAIWQMDRRLAGVDGTNGTESSKLMAGGGAHVDNETLAMHLAVLVAKDRHLGTIPLENLENNTDLTETIELLRKKVEGVLAAVNRLNASLGPNVQDMLGVPPSEKSAEAREQDAELATCIIDATQAASFLAQMGIAFQKAVKGCPLQSVLEKVPGVGALNLAICAGSIAEIVGGFFNAGAFIASAVSHCAVGMNVQALCASGAVGLVGAIAELTDYIILMATDCSILPPVLASLKKAAESSAKGKEGYELWNQMPKWQRTMIIHLLMNHAGR